MTTVTLLSDVVVSAATNTNIIVIIIIIEQTTRARARHTMRAFILELNTSEKSGWVENTTGLYYLVVVLHLGKKKVETHVRDIQIFASSQIDICETSLPIDIDIDIDIDIVVRYKALTNHLHAWHVLLFDPWVQGAYRRSRRPTPITGRGVVGLTISPC